MEECLRQNMLVGDGIKQASLTVTADLGVPPQSTLLQVQREKETRWWWGNHTTQMLRSLFWICPEPAAPQSCSHQQGSTTEHPVALPGREQPNLPRACTRLWHTAGLSVGSSTQPALPSGRGLEQLRGSPSLHWGTSRG